MPLPLVSKKANKIYLGELKKLKGEQRNRYFIEALERIEETNPILFNMIDGLVTLPGSGLNIDQRHVLIMSMVGMYRMLEIQDSIDREQPRKSRKTN